MFYKNSFLKTENFKSLDLTKRNTNLGKISDAKQCYNEPIKITKKKKDDLISLLPYIDKEFHSFYQNLVTNDETIDYHPDLNDENDYD